MGDPSGPPLRRSELLRALARHHVEFVLVGGQVGVVHAALRPTYDLDICVRWTSENLERVGAVLVEIDAGLRLAGTTEPFVPPHRDARFLTTMEVSTWRSDQGDVDVLRGIPSLSHEVRYDELLERADRYVIDGVVVDVASLDDVIASKEVLDRPPDREALPELRAIRTSEADHPPERPTA